MKQKEYPEKVRCIAKYYTEKKARNEFIQSVGIKTLMQRNRRKNKLSDLASYLVLLFFFFSFIFMNAEGGQ